MMSHYQCYNSHVIYKIQEWLFLVLFILYDYKYQEFIIEETITKYNLYNISYYNFKKIFKNKDNIYLIILLF